MPKLLMCPKCFYTRSWVIRRNKRKCKRCRSEWSSHINYPVRGFYLIKRDWENIILSFLKHGTIRSVLYEHHYSYSTIQKAVLYIRKIMTHNIPISSFFGVCEVDETYIGGAWKNKAIHIRRQFVKRGRGTLKQEVFGIVCRNTKEVIVCLVPNGKQRTLFPIIERHIKKGSTIYTDGFKMYRRLKYKGYYHDFVDHDAGEYVRGQVHTQTMDGFWGLLKTHLDSIGGIRKKYAKYYVGEYVWRYNHRHNTYKEKVQKIMNIL